MWQTYRHTYIHTGSGSLTSYRTWKIDINYNMIVHVHTFVAPKIWLFKNFLNFDKPFRPCLFKLSIVIANEWKFCNPRVVIVQDCHVTRFITREHQRLSVQNTRHSWVRQLEAFRYCIIQILKMHSLSYSHLINDCCNLWYINISINIKYDLDLLYFTIRNNL